MFEFKRSVIINGKCFTLHRCVMINEKCQFEKKCDEEMEMKYQFKKHVLQSFMSI